MDGQEIKAILGRNIKLLRTQKDYTQAILADKADISIIFLSSIERGTKYPKAEILARIAKALKVEAFELFKGDLVPSDSKELVIDIKGKLNSALEDFFKQYLG